MKNVVVTVNNDSVNIVVNEFAVNVSLKQHRDIEFIGQGANGVVLLGTNTILNRQEAIKEIPLIANIVKNAPRFNNIKST